MECEICKSQDRLEVDHCHDTGIIRGLLCSECNQMVIGADKWIKANSGEKLLLFQKKPKVMPPLVALTYVRRKKEAIAKGELVKCYRSGRRNRV